MSTTRILKRLFDLVASFCLLVLLSPFFLLVMLLILMTSGRPVFYRWNVLGKNGKPFTGYKFRTMVVNADQMKESLLAYNEMNGPAFKIKDDPRVTKLGRCLRKYSLDEIPQIWSVLTGDMSLVGPRPPSQEEFSQFEEWQKRKLSVTPGMTCLWQVNGRNDISNFSDWAKLDLEYIDNWSLLLDFKILLKTIPTVISGRGAS
ncbi:MAG: sugar transferase [Deltaproteobacteria bacterium]|nr:sugar transferase [Deltaproteobacteria bacterium]